MTITSLQARRLGAGSAILAEASSNLTGTVYFHWYQDGAWLGSSTSGSLMLYVPADDQVRLEAIDTTDPDFDPVANAPAGWPARRTLFWTRSLDADTARYRVEQQQDGGAWTAIAEVVQDDRWSFRVLTPRLVDLASYAWRVVPIDAAGNDGTPRTLAAELVVRTPDGVDFSAAFDGGTGRVTFTEA